MNLIKVINQRAAIRVVKFDKKKIYWHFVTGSPEADAIIESKIIKKPLGTYWIRHDKMFRLEDFEPETKEFIPGEARG